MPLFGANEPTDAAGAILVERAVWLAMMRSIVFFDKLQVEAIVSILRFAV